METLTEKKTVLTLSEVLYRAQFKTKKKTEKTLTVNLSSLIRDTQITMKNKKGKIDLDCLFKELNSLRFNSFDKLNFSLMNDKDRNKLEKFVNDLWDLYSHFWTDMVLLGKPAGYLPFLETTKMDPNKIVIEQINNKIIIHDTFY